MARKPDSVSLFINDVPVKIHRGASIMEAAHKAKVDIPHLCNHPHLTPTGACRLCVVELEGEGPGRPLIAACARPAEAGMRVLTHTDRAVAARRLVLELLLSDHPDDCLTCEQSGHCKLQDLAYEYQVADSRFRGKRNRYDIDAANPFIVRDFEKCVKCYRCAQACQELQFCEVIDYMGRGFDTMVTSALNRPLPETDCVQCGRCVSVCPVGALTEKPSHYRGRSKDLKKTVTTCPYCGVGCAIVLETDGKHIVRVTSREDSPVNKGSLCVKGRFGYAFVNSPDRLTTPLIRQDGELAPASWNEAVAAVAAGLKKTKQEHGADAIGLLSSSKCTNEENYMMQKFARAGVGTNNIDNCARL